MNNIAYCAFDPGKSCGIAAYDKYGVMLWMKTVQHEQLSSFLTDVSRFFAPCKVFIIERFTIWPHKAMQLTYSNLATARAMGEIEGFAKTHGIRTVIQNSTVKNVGYKWMGKKPLSKTNPLNHALDAHSHGLYWLVTNKIVDPATLVK